MSSSDARDRAARLVDRVRRDAGGDERAVRAALLEALRSQVAFDAHAWLLTDPETAVGVDPLADVPCLPQLPELIRLKYLTVVNRWTHLAVPVGLLREATGGELARSLVWRELLSSHGVTDVASMVLRDRFGCWGFIDLWRIDAPPFTAAEAETLAVHAGPLTAAMREARAAMFPGGPAASTPGGPVVLVLSPQLEVRAQTPATDIHLRALLPSDGDRPPVPAAAYNVGAQLVAREAGVDRHPAWARTHLGDGTWLTLRAARIGDGAADPGDIAVTMERSTPGERLGVFVRANGLTARETEVVEHLLAGADTREVAARMHVSALTVQDHLKPIFAKTGSRNRRALVARVVGQPPVSTGEDAYSARA